MNEQPITLRLPKDVPPRIQAALASMSASWRVGALPGGVVVIAGGDWPTAIEDAVSSGAEAVLLVDTPQGLTDDSRIPVVVELGWNHDPAAIAAAPELARRITGDSLVEAMVTGPSHTSPERSLVGQLMLLEELVGTVRDLRVIRADRTGYDLLGTLALGSQVALTAVFSDVLREESTVRLVKPHESIELRLTPPAVASPGSVQIIDESGIRTLPISWETSAREALRSAGSLIRNPGRDAALAALVRTVDVASKLDLAAS